MYRYALGCLTLLTACGTAGRPAGEAADPPPQAPGERHAIVGTIERGMPEDEARARRIKIIGTVHRIMEKEHGSLPPLTPVSKGGAGDPVVEIVNDTDFALTIWFAGKCAHRSYVPPAKKSTELFCPGTYDVAAVVDSPDYMPLVREGQEFAGGVRYQLRIIIRRRPES